MIPAFELSRPKTLDEAMRQVADGGVPYVGGTELVAAMQIGLIAPPLLVDLKRLPELCGVTAGEEGLTIGAATRHREIAASPEVRAAAPILAAACAGLGNMRVRATGSIGGNICFADPRSDVNTALFALGAELVLRSAEGTRTVPVGDVVLGAMDSDLDDGEILVAVRVPRAPAAQVYVRHQPTEYPTVCVAMTWDRSRPDDGLGIVLGAVGERPQTFTAPAPDAVDTDALLPGVETIEDLNGSDEYKRHLAGVFITRAARTMRETHGD
ncbi:FAD binding domain-containing protein [Streptomyces sp. NPDC050560]|uniref:FAD binding domain-containing protein n=1 Tax=Streptomyces sp. NPDC050560 TaxID=3365630 RepID=UPI0037B51B91